MEHKRKIRYTAVFLFLACCVLLLAVLNICIGSVEISLKDIWACVKGQENDHARIPIAGPFVLGISSGAKMTVSLVMVFLWVI